MYKQIVVPIDGSDLAVETVSSAVMFAKIMGARIIFLHAVDFGLSDAGAVLHSFAPDKFAELAKGDSSAVLSLAEVEARRLEVPHQSVTLSTSRPYQAILDVVEEFGADLIFMASHGRRGVKGLLMESQTEKVLAHATVPVLISRIESNASSPQMEKAISIIKGEHRSIAATIHAFRWILGRAERENEPVNLPLLRSMVFYFRSFAARLHHPKEDALLFPLLQKRTSQADETITVLQEHHAEEESILAGLDAAIDAFEVAAGVGRQDAIVSAIQLYADRMWEHVRAVENVILPLCRKSLHAEDWNELARVFELNADPSLDLDLKEGYQKLFVRLMNVAREGGCIDGDGSSSANVVRENRTALGNT